MANPKAPGTFLCSSACRLQVSGQRSRRVAAHPEGLNTKPEDLNINVEQEELDTKPEELNTKLEELNTKLEELNTKPEESLVPLVPCPMHPPGLDTLDINGVREGLDPMGAGGAQQE